MLYRRALRSAGSEVEAIRFDGTEKAARDISMIPGAMVSMQDGKIEVITSFGRKTIRTGQWITRDTHSGALRVYDHDDFRLEYELS